MNSSIYIPTREEAVVFTNIVLVAARGATSRAIKVVFSPVFL